MPQERDATDSDWVNERATVGWTFLRDIEGLWSEVLKLAAVVEDSLNQSIHALCDGRLELANELKRRKRSVDRWEVQIEARVRPGTGVAPASCLRSTSGRCRT